MSHANGYRYGNQRSFTASSLSGSIDCVRLIQVISSSPLDNNHDLILQGFAPLDLIQQT